MSTQSQPGPAPEEPTSQGGHRHPRIKRPEPKPAPPPASLTAISKRERRKVLIRALVSVLALDAGLLLVYSVIPIDDAHGYGPLVMFAVMISVFAIVVFLQIRAIVNSRYPGVRAAAATAFAIPVYLVLWALGYLALAKADSGAFSETINRADSLYFTVTVFSTVGFGDITAISTPARISVTVQMILNLLVLGLVVKLITAAAQYRLSDAAPKPGIPDPEELLE